MLNFVKSSAVLALLVVAACRGGPIPPPPPIAEAVPDRQQGIDLARDTSDLSNELKGGGIDFVARYYRDPDSHLPPLSPSEAQILSSQGLKIVAVWEWHTPDPSHFQYAGGYSDAQMAYAQARAVGQPPGSAIYFAVDYNVPGEALGPVADYFRGIAAGLTASGGGHSEYQIGVYGSGTVCDAIKSAGLARYAWLSSALNWAGAEYDAWDIRQGQRMPDFSFDQDADEAKLDYGGFRVAELAVAADPPAAAPPIEAQQLTSAIAAPR